MNMIGKTPYYLICVQKNQTGEQLSTEVAKTKKFAEEVITLCNSLQDPSISFSTRPVEETDYYEIDRTPPPDSNSYIQAVSSEKKTKIYTELAKTWAQEEIRKAKNLFAPQFIYAKDKLTQEEVFAGIVQIGQIAQKAILLCNYLNDEDIEFTTRAVENHNHWDISNEYANQLPVLSGIKKQKTIYPETSLNWARDQIQTAKKLFPLYLICIENENKDTLICTKIAQTKPIADAVVNLCNSLEGTCHFTTKPLQQEEDYIIESSFRDLVKTGLLPLSKPESSYSEASRQWALAFIEKTTLDEITPEEILEANKAVISHAPKEGNCIIL